MCGIFGIFGKKIDNAAFITSQGLSALQHRGQESSGITSSCGNEMYLHKSMGLVSHVYSAEACKNLVGHMAIGHNRYGTSSKRHSEHHMQPVIDDDKTFSLAHNGNIPDTTSLEIFLDTHGISNPGFNDSEMMYAAIAYHVNRGASLKDAVAEAFPLFTGVFCLLIMNKDMMIAVRDTHGIRPLSLGTLNDDYVVASETCAFDTIQAKFIRDIRPGEMLVINRDGLESIQLRNPQQKLDIFEFVYFARPDSMLLGENVYNVRKRFGRQLAVECPIDADMVIPVPDSGIPAAIGYAQALGLPYEEGLTKNRYVGRTFIIPNQTDRENGVARKLNPIPYIIRGKRLVIVDDSIVRGTTSRKLVQRLYEAGAKEVHLIITSPRILFPDYYGIDTPNQTDLIAAQKTLEEMREFIGVNTLYFLSYKGMVGATHLPENVFSAASFTGEYPVDIGNRRREIVQLRNHVREYVKTEIMSNLSEDSMFQTNIPTVSD